MILTVCAALTILLSAYAVGHYVCAGVYVFGRRPGRIFSPASTARVAALVPAKNEGEGALRALLSLEGQAHRGALEIFLLIKDAEDSAVPFLRARYPGVDFDRPAGSLIELGGAGAGRRVVVAYTGLDPKSEKLNWMIARIDAPYVAILDADHQAEPDWIHSSLTLMEETGARFVQGRRGPLRARGFFPLWDSLHQHIGCELYNVAFTRLGLTVFFTGTTAVMETEVLRRHPLSACITEDIELSYRTFLDRQSKLRILHNPYSGSVEETSPDLYSFLARRRRWANGHTATFFGSFGQTLLTPMRWLERLQLLLHGTHYLVSLLVFALHLAIGAVFLRSTSLTSALAAAAVGGLLAARIVRSQRTIDRVARLIEGALVFLWIFPAIVIAMNLCHAVAIGDLSRAALPIPEALQGVGLMGLVAPLIVLLIGLAGFGQLSGGSFLAVVLTYPAAFYLDLTGVLLGLGDYWLGRARWRPVARGEAEAVPGPGLTRLLPALDIRESWRLRSLLSAVGSRSLMQISRLLRPSRVALIAAVALIFWVGVLYEPANHLEVAAGRCQAMDHDGDPWIVPAANLPGYCGNVSPEHPAIAATRTGTFKTVRDDKLGSIDPTFWDRLDTTFDCNLAVFRPERTQTRPSAGLSFTLGPEAVQGKAFSSGAIATKVAPEAQYTYGRFEAVLKPAKASGVITAFFLYRFDPWQEIDAEFLGKDPTKLLVNVYYNPGKEGDKYNYGMLGTPVLVDLGFDASADFHRYAIEWEQDEIRWFVDDKLIHVRRPMVPTPIPHLPMRLHLNLWPCCSEKLVGPFHPVEPLQAEVRSVSISRWYPAALPRFLEKVDALFSSDGRGDWRKKAKWIQ